MITGGPIGKLDPSKPVRIYGAGLSGLVIGHYLLEKDYQVEIHEKRSKVGGVIESHHQTEGLVETAAHSLLANKEVLDLFELLGIEYVSPQVKLKKWVIHKDKKISQKILSIPQIIKVLFLSFKKVPFTKKEMNHLSLYQFLQPLLGKEKSHQVGSLMYQGIYATDSKNLTVDVLLKGSRPYRYIHLFQILRKRKKQPLKLIAPKTGMAQITNKIYEKYLPHIFLNSSPPLDIEYNNIICSNATNAGEIIGTINPKLQKILMAIDYVPVSSFTFFLKKPMTFLRDSFGVLVTQPNPLLGIISNNSVFAKRSTHPHLHSYTAIGKSSLDIDQVLTTLEESTERPIKNNLVTSYPSFWKKSIPLYNSAHQKLLKEIEKELDSQQGLILFSNYTNNLSVREIITQAKSFSSLL